MTTPVTRLPVHSPAVAAGLPPWRRILAVVAHPDDEPYALGALLERFAVTGADVSVLCLTPGAGYPPAPLSGDLVPLRRTQLTAAAHQLGVARVELRDYPGDHLDAVPRALLAADVAGAVDTWQPDGLLTFDDSGDHGVTGSRDHAAATRATLDAAEQRGLSVLGWGLPEPVVETLNDELGEPRFTALGPGDFAVPVERDRQRLAALAYANETMPTGLVWRRLELLADREHVRWLRRTPSDSTSLVVRYDEGDRFAIDVRGHTVVVDQPVETGGDDEGPTPTELFVAGLTSCIAFYARRYLNRHRLDATGLVVEADYRLAARPARVARVMVRITVPAGVPAERRDGLLAMAGHCTVHNTLRQDPDVTITLT